MEVLLSAMLVRRTERADGSTRQLEHRSVSERLAGRSLRQSGSGSMTGRRSRHRRSAASAVSRRRIGQGVGTISCSEPDRSLLVLPCRCPPWRAKRRMLADVFHWRQIRSAARRTMRVHRYVGKKAMIVYLQLAVENGARRLCQKHFVQGRYRTTAPAVERVCSNKGSRSGSATTCYTLLFRCRPGGLPMF